MENYFVYQSHTDGRETLYASGLSREESDEAMASLDGLIESGCCGDGCATRGNLDDADDRFVARRLGLFEKSPGLDGQ